MAKLKVFEAQLGFFETVVAVASQKAALEAWGLRQDLFKAGGARLADDPDAIAAATARPGEVLRRAAGTRDAFRPTNEPPDSLPAPPAAAKRAKPPTGTAKAPAKSTPEPAPAPKLAAQPRPAAKPPADRSGLTAAEAALSAREARFATALDALDARRHALDDEAAALRSEMDRDCKELAAKVDLSRRAFIKSGGVV